MFVSLPFTVNKDVYIGVYINVISSSTWQQLATEQVRKKQDGSSKFIMKAHDN